VLMAVGFYYMVHCAFKC